MNEHENDYRSDRSCDPAPAERYTFSVTGGDIPFKTEPAPEKPQAKRSRVRKLLAIIAVCLVTAFVGGSLGTYVVLGLNEDPGYNSGLADRQTPDTSEDNSDDTGILPASVGLNVADGSSSNTMTAAEIYKALTPSCVGINIDITATNVFGQTTSGTVSGSGFVITSDGYIATNYHVISEAVDGSYDIKVMLFDGSSYSAKVIGYEEENDIAVLRINATGLTPVTFADSDKMEIGETVYAIGNPLGELTYTMTSGIVSALDRVITTEQYISINMFQIDAAVNSGNSGGPVINANGEVLGIVSAKYASTGVEGLGFAIPANDAVDIIADLIQYGFVTGKPYFGITVVTVYENYAEYYNMVVGAYVKTVDQDSGAAKAGIQVGDIIVKLDNTEITATEDLLEAKYDYKAGDTASVTVWRNGEYITLSVTFDEQGAPKATPQAENSPNFSGTFPGGARDFGGSQSSTSGNGY